MNAKQDAKGKGRAAKRKDQISSVRHAERPSIEEQARSPL
jgi:hypothetical protein